MPLRYLLNKIQPQSTSTCLTAPGRVAAEEGFKKVRQQLRGNMRPLILHSKNNMTGFLASGNVNMDILW